MRWRQDLGPIALVTQLGLTVVATLLVSLLLGIWLDGVLGTRPILTLVFALIGILAGTVGAYRMVNQAIAEATRQRPAAGRSEAGKRAGGAPPAEGQRRTQDAEEERDLNLEDRDEDREDREEDG